MNSTLHSGSLRRHPLHTANRLAQLAKIGFKHPRSRSHVLEFDRRHDSDGLIASLQAAHGMPLLLSDQLLVLGGSVAPWHLPGPTVVGGRVLRPSAGGIDSEPWIDPDIAFDARIAERVLHHVGFLSPSELFLAKAVLRQSVDDVTVDVDGNAGRRACCAGRISQAEVVLTPAGEPRYPVAAHCAWTNTNTAVLTDVWARLLFREGCVLRHLTQRTVAPTSDGVALTCLDSLRRVPDSAVAAGRALIDAGAGDTTSLNALIEHLHESSGGAESAAAYGRAAQQVVARSGERLLGFATSGAPVGETGAIPALDEPFATCLVIGQVVLLARLFGVLSERRATDSSAPMIQHSPSFSNGGALG